jgi:signal transduction histidine kinase
VSTGRDREGNGASGDASFEDTAMLALSADQLVIAGSSLGESTAHSPDPVATRAEAHDTVSDASHQLRALAALSGSLTDPLTPSEAAEIVERHALAALGASSAVVVTLGPFPPNDTAALPTVLVPAVPSVASDDTTGGRQTSAAQTLTLIHSIGVPDVSITPEPLSLDAPIPLAEVARTGQPIFLNSDADLRRYSTWGEAVLHAGGRAAAAVPVWANGHLRGVLGLTWDTPRVFDKDECAFVLILGVMCAQAIMRAHLAAAERRARVTAEHATRTHRQFLRTMSHELRTPLNAVVGYTQLLAEEIVGELTVVQKDHLRRARRASEHVLALVDELLRFARLDAGQEVVHLESVIAADVLEEAIDVVRPIAELKGVRIRIETADRGIVLETDRVKLRQILVNLVTNAVKYTDVGDVVLIVRVEGLGTALTVKFEVTDTGRGIAAADLSYVFEAFWQAPHPLRRQSDGTGLGLSVARQLARLLGGDVVVARSEIGRGSTFLASLPAHPPAGEASKQTGEDEQISAQLNEGGPDGHFT